MTDSNHSVNEVVALLEERRRYESWLQALDARRDTTPGHVFERVQTDYRARLARVDEQIDSHRHAIEQERASVQSRLSLLEAEERTRRDERAELELRTHVGELSGSEAESAFKSVDDALAELTGEKTSLQARVAELETILEPRATPAETAPPIEEIPPAGVMESAQPVENDDVVPIEALKSETPAEQQASEGDVRLRTPSGSFDELAFLNTVVGAEAAAPQVGGAEPLIGASRRDSSIVRDDVAGESLLAGIGDTPPRNMAAVPLARNVPANTPIVLKATSSVEQVKTLKCSECGAMNYPTEWYCERCGAELAAL